MARMNVKAMKMMRKKKKVMMMKMTTTMGNAYQFII
jgi:hypothetical protein